MMMMMTTIAQQTKGKIHCPYLSGCPECVLQEGWGCDLSMGGYKGQMRSNAEEGSTTGTVGQHPAKVDHKYTAVMDQLTVDLSVVKVMYK